MPAKQTIVGAIQSDVLTFTVGKDPALDAALAEADCLGSAAHATMLARMPLRPKVFSEPELARVMRELLAVIRDVRRGRFKITERDQDVHLAVERRLTRRLGVLGERIHTGRSRNDQVAVNLRLYAKEQLCGVIAETAALADRLLRFARRHARLPMVGRTHLQPAMPSSVGLWASAYAEGLLDDLILLRAAFDYNDRCPLGSAAGYGVPLPIDRQLTARLLGFAAPLHNVLHAANARGQCEAAILAALAQVMRTLSRLAEDLLLYTTPEFGYFHLPPDCGTGSSIMPQKRNPDVLELVRARAVAVQGQAAIVAGIVCKLPGGYSRDLQETKEPFIEGLRTTRACLRIMALLADGLRADRQALLAGFTAAVFATDRALELVGRGLPFREAYDQVKAHLTDLRAADPYAAVAKKTHLGGPAGLDFKLLAGRAREAAAFARRARAAYYRAVSRMLGVDYPRL
jgi:argininosuccinate lyase